MGLASAAVEVAMRQLMMCVIPVLALGCEGTFGIWDEFSCTTDIRYSVSVSVDDDADGPVSEATVEYTVDAGAAVACEEGAAGVYACGEEMEGDITVRATADGFGADEETVTVLADECHVIGESVTLILPIQD
ncbi:MAG: hypothetical protein ACJATT_001534 [Myxococcota bacterium]|jgi:hypothetical protein